MAGPSSIHSLPTEQYNQDVVSLGMHAAVTAMDAMDSPRPGEAGRAPYRKSKSKRLYYRDPAYLFTSDLRPSAKQLLQIYFVRWQIVVNHREEKDKALKYVTVSTRHCT
jgi:hypothetical protein